MGALGLGDVCAEHQLDDLLLGARRHVDDADRMPVAEHRGAVAERRNLEKTVGDEDDGTARLALTADDVEHALGEVRRQRRGHLVEKEQVGLDRERPREIEDAEHGERHVARRLAEVEVGNAELLDPVEERLDRRVGEAEVGRDVEVGDQGRFLIHRDQAGAAGFGRRVDVARLAADQDVPGGRPDRAGENLDERRLAGAIRPHQCVDLAGPHRQRRVAQRRHRAVVLGDAGGFEDERFGHWAVGHRRSAGQ